MIGDYLEHYFTNNANLKSEMRTIPFKIKGEVFTFFSDLGVFSKDKIDYGSRLLLEIILKHTPQTGLRILDVGCGYGFFTVCLGRLLDSEVFGVDVNDRALHLCKKNMKENNIRGDACSSNAYENVRNTYDIIVTNPPIRAGKKVVLDILLQAKSHLKEGGYLWFVMRKDQGVKSILKRLDEGYLYEVLEKSKGFYCIRAKER